MSEADKNQQPTQQRQNVDWMTRNVDMTGAKRSAEDINAIRQSLDEQEVTTRARMSERIFVGLWLAVFYKGQNEFYPQVNLNLWANYAGNEYREVDIIGQNGEVLFSVPPLFDRAGIKALTGDDRRKIPGGNILNVIRNADMRSKVSPNDGKAFLNHHLRERAMVMGQLPPSVKENIIRWNTIFTKYGLPPIVEMAEVTQPHDSVSNNTIQQVTSNEDWELL